MEKKTNKPKLRLRDLRLDNDLFQKHVADFLTCTQQTYSRYETGELEPSLSVLAKLSVFYDTSVDYIMGLTDEHKPYTRIVVDTENNKEVSV
ncbi:MAG: helix-turn-helix domain-containing protein [Ruminococcus sp.]|jgi:transcriptional regulator with XRE-family HTH domain|nr:helix-turn-helix domain-containing protein [Ruminococcus sp.]